MLLFFKSLQHLFLVNFRLILIQITACMVQYILNSFKNTRLPLKRV